MSYQFKADFPALQHKVNGAPITFLDSAASAQKPQMVIDAMGDLMEGHYANIHRGLYDYSQKTTAAYELARAKVADFIGADSDEIIFTRNATESINLIAASWGGANLEKGDEILITALEHHANIVPWQMITDKTGAVLKVAPIDDDGNLILEQFNDLISAQTKMVAISHMSNALGTLLPVETIIQSVRKRNDQAVILLDGCQAVVHRPVNVKTLDCDFYVFSGHKLYGPSGIGVLYGKQEIIEDMPPYQGGGDMIETVRFEASTYAKPPARFEAGTPAIVEAIGLGAAVDYLRDHCDWPKPLIQEEALFAKAEAALRGIDGLTLYSRSDQRTAILSFNIEGMHASDIGTLLDQQGVAVRVGHHCAMPLMERLGVNATVRASLGLYNDETDIERLIEGIKKIKMMIG